MNAGSVEINTTTVRRVRNDDGQRWNEYAEQNPYCTYCHQWEWQAVFQNSFKAMPYYYLAEHDNKIVGIFPNIYMKSVLFGRYMISLPWLDYGGPVADSAEIAELLISNAGNEARDLGCQFLEMRAVGMHLPNLTEKLDKREFHLDLTGGQDKVWASFDAKARNQVRKAEKSGLIVCFGKTDLLDEFYRIFSRNMRDLGTPVWPKSLFAEIFNHFGDTSEIALVRMDNEPIAAALLLHYRKYSTVPSASARREFLKYCPNNIMYWEIIKRCIEKGSKVFDFGRSSEGAGTYRFKKQWVKNPKEQVWQYQLYAKDSLPELNPNNPKFKLLIGIWRKLPVPIANLIGPKIVTKLP
ncbi:MAG: FemAB family XrtA/PEP-CTERM system-associated protein [candidate division Zixibacteria bacterium]